MKDIKIKKEAFELTIKCMKDKWKISNSLEFEIFKRYYEFILKSLLEK